RSSAERPNKPQPESLWAIPATTLPPGNMPLRAADDRVTKPVTKPAEGSDSSREGAGISVTRRRPAPTTKIYDVSFWTSRNKTLHFPYLDYLPKGNTTGTMIHMTKPTLKIVSPATVKRKVMPRRPKNADVRTREYLTEKEVDKLIEGCEGNRQPHRDQTMILIAFRHGLRASEVCDLQWTQVDFAGATLAVARAKHGTPSTHPLTGRELRALRRLHREAESRSPFLFMSERGSPMTVSNFQKLISRACEAAGLKIKAHPHMLRHACGYKLANEGHDTRGLQAYLGHKNIQHTVRYTELAPTRFKGWWKD